MPPLQQSAGISGTTTPGSTTSSVTTVTDVAQRLIINVRIEGQGPYRFLVDTGADRTVVATDVAAELGLIAGERVMLEGVVRAVAAETVSVSELSFGTVRCRDLVVPILPASMLEADGYLGLDVLDNHRVTLDFQKSHFAGGRFAVPAQHLLGSTQRGSHSRHRVIGPSASRQLLGRWDTRHRVHRYRRRVVGWQFRITDPRLLIAIQATKPSVLFFFRASRAARLRAAQRRSRKFSSRNWKSLTAP